MRHEMVCKEAVEYPVGEYRKPGDKFLVDERDVKVLTVVGRAELVTSEPKLHLETVKVVANRIAEQPRVKRKYTKRKTH